VGAGRAPLHDLPAQPRAQLVLEEHPVDRVLGQGALVVHRRGVDQRPGLVAFDGAPGGHVAKQLLEGGVGQPVRHLAGLFAHGVAREHIARRLIRRDLDDVGTKPDPLQDIGQEHVGAGVADCVHVATRHQQDFVTCAGQVVGGAVVGRGIAHHPLAGASKFGNQLAKRLHLRLAKSELAEVQDDAAGARIGGDTAEVLVEVREAHRRSSREALPAGPWRRWHLGVARLDQEQHPARRPSQAP
jgi:hypothetical protein